MSDAATISAQETRIPGQFGQNFESWFFAGQSRGDLPRVEEADLANSGGTLLALAARRQPGQASIELSGRRLFIVNDDMPFLIESLATALEGAGVEMDRLIHPIVPVVRDSAGHMTALGTGALRPFGPNQ